MNVGRVADPATTAGSVAKDCRADLLKLPNDCSDCMTSGHRLLRVYRAYPFHRTETELERSESVDGLERLARFCVHRRREIWCLSSFSEEIPQMRFHSYPAGLIVGRSLRSRKSNSGKIEGDGADLVHR